MREKNKENSQKSNRPKLEFGPFWLWGFPLLGFLIKLIVIANIPTHIWLGADGESYLKGVDALLQSGLYSKEGILQYFPAGYPILIFLFAKISVSNALVILAIFQSMIFAWATWLLGKFLLSNNYRKILPWLIFFITFNPTFSLASLAIGYESLVASALLFSIIILFKIKQSNTLKTNFLSSMGFGLISGFTSFLQPRYLATSLIILAYWIVKEFKIKLIAIKLLSAALIVLMISPAALMYRNQKATGKAFISNNLGVTMNVGAGPKSTGGYTNKATGVTCPENVKTDNQRVLCVLKWYATNPVQTVRLSFNKTLYFFSPWSGPMANGTMARNPWLKVNPVTQIAKSPGGWGLVYGWFGKLTSWIWEIAQIGLLIWGFIWLRRQAGELRQIATISGLVVTISWLVSVGTIGDHRFRVPVMGFMLVLQIAGVRGLSKKPLILNPSRKKR